MDAANFSADWLLNLAQIFGLPFRWANYDPSAPQETVDRICTMLQNMGSAGWAAFPTGTTLELRAEGQKSGAQTPQGDMLDRADKQCDLLVLGQTLTTDTGGMGSGGGSHALGQVHADVRSGIIDAAAQFAAGVIEQQLIPAILRLNYGDAEEAPTLHLQTVTADNLQEKAAILAQLTAAGAGSIIPLDWLGKTFGIPKPKAGEATLAASKRQKQMTTSNEEDSAIDFVGSHLRQAEHKASDGIYASNPYHDKRGRFTFASAANLTPTNNAGNPGPAEPAGEGAPSTPSVYKFQLGDVDPKYKNDEGSGGDKTYNTMPSSRSAAVAKAAIQHLLNLIPGIPDAKDNLNYYFAGTGKPKYVPLTKMITELPAAKSAYRAEVSEAISFADSIAQPSMKPTNFDSKQLTSVSINDKSDSNWFLAIGGHSVWGKGIVSMDGDDVVLDFTYQLRDTYNWDNSKVVNFLDFDNKSKQMEKMLKLTHMYNLKIGDVPLMVDGTVTDEGMGLFHKMGLAREYPVKGEAKTTIRWPHGHPDQFKSVVPLHDSKENSQK